MSKMMRYGRSGQAFDADEEGLEEEEAEEPRIRKEDSLERFLVRPGKRNFGDNFMARASKRNVGEFLARPGKRDFGNNFMARASRGFGDNFMARASRAGDVNSFLARPGKRGFGDNFMARASRAGDVNSFLARPGKRNFGDNFMARASRSVDVNSFLARPGKRNHYIHYIKQLKRPNLIHWPYKRAHFDDSFMARASRANDDMSSFLARPGKRSFGDNFMARASRADSHDDDDDVAWPGKRSTAEFLARPGKKRGVVRIVKRGVVRIVKKGDPLMPSDERYVRRRRRLYNIVKKLVARANRERKKAKEDFDSDRLLLRVIKRDSPPLSRVGGHDLKREDSIAAFLTRPGKRNFGDNFMARASRSARGDEELDRFLTRPGRSVADFLSRPGKRGGGIKDDEEEGNGIGSELLTR